MLLLDPSFQIDGEVVPEKLANKPGPCLKKRVQDSFIYNIKQINPGFFYFSFKIHNIWKKNKISHTLEMVELPNFEISNTTNKAKMPHKQALYAFWIIKKPMKTSILIWSE